MYTTNSYSINCDELRNEIAELASQLEEINAELQSLMYAGYIDPKNENRIRELNKQFDDVNSELDRAYDVLSRKCNFITYSDGDY